MVEKKSFMDILQGLKPAMAMVVVQAVCAGMNIFYKLAVIDGMSLRIITAYRYLFAVPIMLPLALFFERDRPKLTWTILFQAFLCGLFGGSLSQNLYIESLSLTSATFVSAMTNLIPVITLIFTVILGMEKLAIRTMSGKAKVLGTLTGIGGAMLLTFYKGVQVNVWPAHLHLLNNVAHGQTSPRSGSSITLLGAFLSFGSCISLSVWLIIQARMSKNYPCPYSSTALMCIMGAIQSNVYALSCGRDMSEWKLGWNIRLLTVAYAGIAVSGLTCVFISWCLRLKGPLYCSIFNPLLLVLVALAESLLLQAKLYLGSILGAVFIVLGLYMVLWGKGEEMKMVKDQLSASTKQQPMEIIVDNPNGIQKINVAAPKVLPNDQQED